MAFDLSSRCLQLIYSLRNTKNFPLSVSIMLSGLESSNLMHGKILPSLSLHLSSCVAWRWSISPRRVFISSRLGINSHADNPIITFSVKGIFAQDVAFYLNTFNVSVRSGEHCSKMLNGALEMEKSVRLSLYLYNTDEDVDVFLEAIRTITLEKTIDLYL